MKFATLFTSLLVWMAQVSANDTDSGVTFLRGLDEHRALKGKATCPETFPSNGETCGNGNNWSKLDCKYDYRQVPTGDYDPETGICSGPLVCTSLSSCGCDIDTNQWVCAIPGLLPCAEGSVEGVYDACKP